MRIVGGASAPAAEAAPTTPEAPAAPAPRSPTDDTLRLELTGERRFAGGRPLPWWSERLGRLRRDGPEELYRLTLARASAAGLAVTERPGGGFEVAAARVEVQR